MAEVAVITGYYNRKEFLEPTIRSVLNQTHRDLELVVFDDASTDGSAERLTNLAEELADPRLTVRLHDRNIGFTQGMVNAIEATSSAYVAVQGSGDLSAPTRLERQLDHLGDNPDVVAVGCWYTNVVASNGARRPRRPTAEGKDFDALLQSNVYSHGEVTFRRDAYENVGGYRPAFKNNQDYDLWLRMVRIGQLATVPENLYDRYIRSDGVSYDPTKFAVQARYFLLCQRIAAQPVDVQEELVAELGRDGPLGMISPNDPALQNRFFKVALRSIAWGGMEEARVIADRNISSPIRRTAVRLLAGTLGNPVSRPVMSGLRRGLGFR